MAQQIIGIGASANDGTGDPLRTVFDKTNTNFNELYAQTGWASYVDTGYTSGSPLVVSAGVDTLLTNRAQNVIDHQKPYDIKTFYAPVVLTAGAITGTFVEGETVTGGTSGATGVLKEIAGTKFRLVNLSGTFASSELITGGTSGATTTYSAKKNAVITGRNGDNLDLMLYFKVLPTSTNSELDIWVNIGGSIGELYRQTFLFRSTTGKGVMYTLPSAYTLGTWETNGGQIYVRASSNMSIYEMNFNFDRSHKAH